MKSLLIHIFFIAWIFLSALALGVAISPIYESFMNEKEIANTIAENPNCRSDDVFMTSECLRRELLNFYNYNYSNIDLFKDKEIDWDMIKEQGGVCWHYSQWYIQQAKSLGLEGKQINIFGDEDLPGHAFAVIYNKNVSQYCILDQTRVLGCNQLGGSDEI